MDLFRARSTALPRMTRIHLETCTYPSAREASSKSLRSSSRIRINRVLPSFLVMGFSTILSAGSRDSSVCAMIPTLHRRPGGVQYIFLDMLGTRWYFSGCMDENGPCRRGSPRHREAIVGELACMDSTGDTKLIWSKNIPDEVK